MKINIINNQKRIEIEIERERVQEKTRQDNY
jgi:hypothetical protein